MEIPSILLLPINRVWRTYPGGMKLDLMEGRVCFTGGVAFHEPGYRFCSVHVQL